MEQKEIWKPIKGYEGLYLISNLGNIKNKRGKYRKISIGKRGYKCVTLCKNGKHKNKTLHRLLMESFVPNPENKPHIDHIDGNRLNNNLNNLRWVTQKENNNNPVTKGKLWRGDNRDDIVRKMLETRSNNGGKYSPIKIYAYTKHGEFFKSYYSIGEAARIMGVDAKRIQSILNNNHKQVCGYIWSTVMRDDFIYVEQKHKSLKPVQQLDSKGNIIKEWESLSSLAREINNVMEHKSFLSKLGKYIRKGKIFNGCIYKYKY